jgi:hypothetical protein
MTEWNGSSFATMKCRPAASENSLLTVTTIVRACNQGHGRDRFLTPRSQFTSQQGKIKESKPLSGGAYPEEGAAGKDGVGFRLRMTDGCYW